MIRKPRLSDVPEIHALINARAKQGEMLARPLSEIYENLRDYFIYVHKNHVKGVAGLHLDWEDLAEVKSVAVKPAFQGRGLGRQLVEACIAEGQALGVRRFFALTYVPDFFKRLGFVRIDRNILPHKVWTECLKCPKFPDCDEIAVMKDLAPGGPTRSITSPKKAKKVGKI